MSDDIKKEIEKQVTGTRISIMKEMRRYLASFYIAVFGMLFCLMIGFYIGNSKNNGTNKMMYHTQKKVDLILIDLGIKYNG